MSDPAIITRLARIDKRYPFGTTLALTYLGILFACLPNLADPFVRHDDFLALLRNSDAFYVKTLSEGRWISYLSHMRPFPILSWQNLLVYHFTAAAICAGLAVNALGRHSAIGYRAALAIFAWLGILNTLISQWYHTYMLGMAFVALYAWLATICNERQTRLLLIPFVPLTFMAYPTYPLVLLAFCLTRHDGQRSFLDGLRLMLLFIACYAAAVLLSFAVNYVFHGVFGVEVAQWRGGNPLTDWASFLVNLGRMKDFASTLYLVLGFGYTPLSALHIFLFAVAIYALCRHDFWRGIYIFVGMLAGLSLLTLQAVKTGVSIPVRIFGFGWMFYALALVLFVQMLAGKSSFLKYLGGGLLAVLLLVQVLLTQSLYKSFRPWQADTRALAARIGEGPEPVYLIGTHKALPSWKGPVIQYPYGLKWRIAYLTHREVRLCTYQPDNHPAEACPGVDLGAVQARRVADHTTIEPRKDHILVILPREEP